MPWDAAASPVASTDAAIHGPCRHVQCQSLRPASRVLRANRVRPQPVRSDDSDTSDIHGRGERPIDTRRCLHRLEAEFAGWHHYGP